MKIISSYPIISNNKVIANPGLVSSMDSSLDTDYAAYCNADADGDFSNANAKKKKKSGSKPKPTPAQKAAPAKKILKGLDKAKESGLTDSLKTIGRGLLEKKASKGTGAAPVSKPAATPPAEVTPEATGMSKNTKIAIGVTAGVVLIVVGYFVFKKKK